MEKIVAAALFYKPEKLDPKCPDYRGLIFSVPAPGRHGDVLIPLSQMHEDAALACEQGFLTDQGRFANRLAAKALVRRNGQPTIRDTHPTQLFSEDLW